MSIISNNHESPKIGFASLGCAKATVDSERILTQLRIRGYQMVNDYDDADLVIVNTCGFIESAIDESLGTIEEALAENGKVIVTGCLGAREDVIAERFPSVLGITGPNETEAVLKLVNQHLPVTHDPYVDIVPPGGLKLTPRHYAYLKISEGCNHKCRFCIIPQMRGKLVSRSAADVIAEAEALVSQGVKELLIVSQDTSAYGMDIKHAVSFHHGQPVKAHMVDLCRALARLGVWTRLHYVYPYPHVDDLIPLMADGLVLPYLDIPFQHASPSVLKAMRRPAHAEKVLQRIHTWREMCPDLTIRSTFIVGFPGETDEDFDMLLDFIEQAEIERVGCFRYSPVEGATANELPNPVSAEVSEARYDELMQLQMQISAKRLKRKVGQRIEVIVDQVGDGIAIGRSQGDAPEVDGIVEIGDTDANLKSGDFITIEVESSDEYDLFGRQVNV